ncbi:MAG: fatty acyl-AMP ligase, partial [Pseudomonadota bacterium]
MPYASLRDSAVDTAHRLTLAFPAGARIGLIAQTCPDFHILFYACQYAGLAPVPLPLPVNLGGRDSYVAQIRQMMQNAGASGLAAPADLMDYAKEAAAEMPDVVVGAFEDFRSMPKGDGPLRPFGPDDLCYIQYSSGSTSAPKGVLGTQRSVTSNIRSILNDGLDARQGDRAVSWLPLYHDMGLIGFALAPLMSQITIDYVATSDFVRRPMIWPKLISENRGSLSFSPSFGYDLCARRAAKVAVEDYDLSCWRVAGIGGDMVRPDALERFVETFGPAGFKTSFFVPSYGLAESTLAVSFARLEDDFRVDEIDMQHYTRSSIAQPASAITKEAHRRRFVVCGSAMSEHGLEVRGEDGRALADREVGRVMIKGPSVTPGYFQNRQATEAMFSEDGWMDTGDMGYMLDGEVVITGRSKDLILYNGRNIWPQDIEWAVEKLPGVKDGGVAAFSVQ